MSNRKKVEHSGLELRIDIKPENKNRNFVRNSKNASDEILIMDHTFPWWLRVPLLILSCGLIYFIFIFDTGESNNVSIFETCLYIIAFLACLYPTVMAIDPTKEQFILNRKNGIITFPERFPISWLGKTITILFSDVKLGFGFRGTAHFLTGLRLAILYPNGQNRTVVGMEVADTFAFLVWYMDRNRPLPPGELFDPYRQKDFERRKAEGFPPPLYPSSIPTPEATPEQQKEREKYWKD